jgi:SAM-dependent methyltransferase
MTKLQCPGCFSKQLGHSFPIKNQPVILNYRFSHPEEATTVPRRDMCLRECLDCGLIFNAILDESAIPYDERYENRQTFSAAFRAMQKETVDAMIRNYGLASGTILEVGCGKGDFLKLICRRANACGFGYDTSCEEEGHDSAANITFFKRYVSSRDITGNLDLILCRHVVEHVASIGEFFRLLHGIAVAGGGTPVYVETPAWEWIVENQAFWDVFNEHCNYFPTHSLRRIAELAGFSVLDHRLIFGGQYQALELSPSPQEKIAPLLHREHAPTLERFSACLESARTGLEHRLHAAGASGKWAIWGAGGKGVSLTNAFVSFPPTFVVDSNPAKQGMFIPGTAVPILSPSDPRIAEATVILVANGNYEMEIRNFLFQRKLNPELLIV